MAVQPRWLNTYYDSAWLKALAPVVVLEGDDRAVVRVGGTNYILVKKSGRHGVTTEQPLFQGNPTPIDMDEMRLRMRLVDR